jgi:hypothetical protein
MNLEESASAVIRPTVTVQHFSRNTAHIIVIIPGQLCSSTDICQCKECHPGETQVMGVYKYILDKHVWTAWMLKQDASKRISLSVPLQRKYFRPIFTFMWLYIVTNFLIIKLIRCTNFSNLFWKWNYMFQTVSLSIIRSYSLYTQQWYMSYRQLLSSSRIRMELWSSILTLLESCLQTCMTYTSAECTVNDSWWWTEELSETCRVSFQNKFEKLVRLVGFIVRKFVTMHGHMSRCTVTWMYIKKNANRSTAVVDSR